MIEVVKIGSSTISVRDDLADRVIAVCLRCKGFKSLWRTEYRRGDYGRPGIIWVGHQVVCPRCEGKGLYYRDQIVKR